MKKNQAIPDFGDLIGVDGAVTDFSGELPENSTNEAVTPDANNPLWEYYNLGKLDGWDIDEDAKGLPIETSAILLDALYPEMIPNSELLVISQDNPDGIQRYNEIKQLEASKQVMVTGESSQYDSTKAGYVVWIKYCWVKYKLKPRFEYLKEEK